DSQGSIGGRGPRDAVDDALAPDRARPSADFPRRPAWPQPPRTSADQLPRPAKETNPFAIDVPLLGSLILTHSLDGEVKGLKDFKLEDRPPVAIPFFAFRIMVGIGLLLRALV